MNIRRQAGPIGRVMVAAGALGAALMLLSAGTAGASTPGCTTGYMYMYCGSQADEGPPVLVIDSLRQGRAYGNPVIGWPDSGTDPGTDWFQLTYGGGTSSAGIMFQFTPGGSFTSMCMSDPGNGLVVLRPCNGSNWQRWVPSLVGTSGYTMTNRATHRILQANGKGGQLTTVARPVTPGQNQLWKFSS